MRILKSFKELLIGIWNAQKVSIADPMRKKMINYNDALTFVILGDLLGYQFLSAYYSRVFFVHLLERIPSWRRRSLKERDILDKLQE